MSDQQGITEHSKTCGSYNIQGANVDFAHYGKSRQTVSKWQYGIHGIAGQTELSSGSDSRLCSRVHSTNPERQRRSDKQNK